MPKAKKNKTSAQTIETSITNTTSTVEPVKGSKEFKTALMVIMLTRTEGTTIKEMAEQLGWLENSVRGAMSLIAKNNKLGATLQSVKQDGIRRYFLAGVTEEGINKAYQETQN